MPEQNKCKTGQSVDETGNPEAEHLPQREALEPTLKKAAYFTYRGRIPG